VVEWRGTSRIRDELLRPCETTRRRAAGKAKGELDEFRLRVELDKAYQELATSAFELMEAGELTQPHLREKAERIRRLRAQLDAKPSQ
jgi:hypothetical protein